MTEMEQSGIEVILVFADNVRGFTKRYADNVFAVILSQMLAKSCERDHNMIYIIHNKWSSDDLSSRETISQ